MDAKDALLKTKVQWIWYRDNPGRSRKEYFIKHNIKNIPLDKSYLCQYVQDSFGTCYENCPVLWTEHSRFCYEDGSPFVFWQKAWTSEKPWYAQQVIDLIDGALDVIQGRKKENDKKTN